MPLRLLRKVYHKIRNILNITSVDDIFEVIDNIDISDDLFINENNYTNHNTCIVYQSDINYLLRLATLPLRYIEDIKDEDVINFSYIQKLIKLNEALDKNIVYPNHIFMIKYSDYYVKSNCKNPEFIFGWSNIILKDGTQINDIILPYGKSFIKYLDSINNKYFRNMITDEYRFNSVMIMLTLEIAVLCKYYRDYGLNTYNTKRIIEETSSLCVLIGILQKKMKANGLRSFTDITSDRVLSKVFKCNGWSH